MAPVSIRALVILAGVSCLGGCTDAPIIVDGHRSSAILNGELDPGHEAVGVLYSGTSSACTATLVGPDVVLTAAHCVTSPSPPYAVLQPVSFYAGGLQGSKHVATSVAVHPAYNGGNQSDLALVRLASAVQGVEPLALPTGAPEKGEPIVLVGYGLAAKGAPSASFGTKRSAQSTISQLTDTLLGYGLEGGDVSGMTCGGDSGGPVVAKRNGVEQVIGVHSTGDCETVGYAMRVDAFRSWISQQAASAQTGAEDRAAPEVAFLQPSTGAMLGPSFTVSVSATDDVAVQTVVLFVDGQIVGQREQVPFTFDVEGISPGAYQLKAVAYDVAGNATKASLEVRVGKQGLAVPADYGAPCSTAADCQGQVCAEDVTTGQRFCSGACDVTDDSCPEGSVCHAVEQGGICGPLHDGSEDDVAAGGCNVGGAATGSPLWLLALLALGSRFGRQRRRA